jgi:hypothetical protein
MRMDASELCRVNGGGLRELIREKYGLLTKFYVEAPQKLGVCEQTLKRFIGSGKPSQKKLARNILALLGRDEGEYGAYFRDGEKKRGKAANNREVIEALIMKVEELQVKIDNLGNMISIYHRWGRNE